MPYGVILGNPLSSSSESSLPNLFGLLKMLLFGPIKFPPPNGFRSGTPPTGLKPPNGFDPG